MGNIPNDILNYRICNTYLSRKRERRPPHNHLFEYFFFVLAFFWANTLKSGLAVFNLSQKNKINNVVVSSHHDTRDRIHPEIRNLEEKHFYYNPFCFFSSLQFCVFLHYYYSYYEYIYMEK